MKSYLAMLSIGKNDFEAINTIESEFYPVRLGRDPEDSVCL